MKKINWIIILIGLVIPYILIFQSFFSLQTLSFGDAPYFHDQNLQELFQKPLLWDSRVDNFGASQEKILWLYIPTFLIGLLNHYFGLPHEISVRLIFFIPSTIVAIIGSWLFISTFTKNIWSIFLGTVLYSFNTYNIMVIDGGQIGIALAYGIFPLASFVLKQFISIGNIKNFLLTILVLFTLSNSDIRVLLLLFSLFFVWYMFSALINKNINILYSALYKIIFIFVISILLNAFWVIPFIYSFNTLNLSLIGTNNFVQNVSLINSLLLFHPQFPINEFGKIIQPPFYFGFVPFLILFGLSLYIRIDSSKFKMYFSLLVTYLVFLFLSKGNAEPFGNVYSALIQLIPFGVAFRDSTKFWIPLLLVSSVLLALNIEFLREKIKSWKFFCLIITVCYFFLLYLLHPAMTQQLTGTLKVYNTEQSLVTVNNLLQEQSGFYRTLWFPSKPQTAFASWDKPAISAIDLHKEDPFALMINGNYDLFNFLHSPLLTDWYKLLGIKYIFYPENPVKKSWTDKEREERILFVDFISALPGFKKIPIDVSFPVFELEEKPNNKVFTQNKMIVVLGDGSIYEYLKDKINFDLTKIGFLFLEDGILNPDTLLNLPASSFVLLFHGRDILDLSMVFLRDKFVDLVKFDKGSWGYLLSNEYLNIKNELRKNGIKSYDLGFKNGMIYSSITDEVIQYKLKVPVTDKYYLAIRSIGSNESSVLEVDFVGKNYYIDSSEEFIWNIYGPFSLDKRDYILSLKNKGGFHAINAIALINTEDWDRAGIKSQELVNISGKMHSSSEADLILIDTLSKQLTTNDLIYNQIDPTKYQVILKNQEPTWVVFSDRYSPLWRLEGSNVVFPVYSMINSFWISGGVETNLVLEYIPQRIINKTLIISVLSFIIMLSGIIIYKLYKKIH